MSPRANTFVMYQSVFTQNLGNLTPNARVETVSLAGKYGIIEGQIARLPLH